MGNLVPALGWLRSYDRAWLKADIVAGLTAAAVVIPNGMAYATIVDLPLQVGIYTAFIPMLAYALLGTSRVLSVSTTTTIAILAATALGSVATTHPEVAATTALATLALLVGAMLLAARAFRLGFIANFISDPVLTGFKAGIGLVMIVSQVPKLLGVHIEKAGFFRDLLAIANQVPQSSIPTVIVAAATLAVIVVLRRIAPKAPVPLVAIACAIGASVMLGLPSMGVSVVGSIPSGFPPLTVPHLPLALELWPAAAGIALMSFTETIAVGRAFTRERDPRPDSNQELVAIGAGNVAGAFFGAMPSGGGASQTAVNANGGARTQVAELATAAVALATMLFLAPVLAPMPNAALAAVVIMSSIHLIKVEEMASIRRVRTLEFRWMLAAFAGVVFLGTLQGIIVAVVLSMAGLLSLANNPPLHVLGRKPGTNVFRPRDGEHPEDESFPGLLIVRTEGRMYFANAPVLGEKMRELIAREKPRVLVLDCSVIPGLEYTALKMLVGAEANLREQGIELWLVALNPEALELVRRTPLAQALGRGRMFFNLEAAVDAYLGRGRP
ncbi:MAG TPA: SulP family inorganic anion transporter [Usitatibacter sp.]|nr:SulP family inorganic anion transporter [Usitatibacter sp.]